MSEGSPFMSSRRRDRGRGEPARSEPLLTPGGREAPAAETGPAKEAEPAKWEYRWQANPLLPVPDAPNLLIDALNPLGAEGWEVCGFTTVPAEDTLVAWVLMKRPATAGEAPGD